MDSRVVTIELVVCVCLYEWVWNDQRTATSRIVSNLVGTVERKRENLNWTSVVAGPT
jgi:hypothetical protein